MISFGYDELSEPIVLRYETLSYKLYYTSPQSRGEKIFIAYCEDEATAADIVARMAMTLPGGSIAPKGLD